MKKAAMFGLDARIALAIFGALSVISGAALYSAIEDAKVTSIISEFNEYGKAYEQYYLDVGSVPAKPKDLVEDPSLAGWAGPYLSLAVSTINTDSLEYNRTENAFLYFSQFKRGDFVGPATHSGTCTDVNDCDFYLSVRLSVLNNYFRSIASALSQRVDGTTSLLTGRVRYLENPSYYYFYYKYMPAQSL
tara:strand:+ start:608 stop:1177 length:570 start_codon:yes stop_codon:yes gene_type:complete